MNVQKTITVIGGGTGQSSVLRGLKKLPCKINAIVTMADDGGSSGMLREDLGMLPPGDIRNCILALSNTELEMEALFQYRFKDGSLKGQNFGNLFLAALTDMNNDFETAVSKISEILAVRGKIIPVTLDDVRLKALFKNGNEVFGESVIADKCQSQNTQIDKIKLIPEDAQPFAEAVNALKAADIIILSPGSLYTSLIPNLIVKGISETIKKSAAKKIFICNIMTENGETTDYKVMDFIKAIYKHADIGPLDYVIVNNQIPPDDIQAKYMLKNQKLITLDEEERKILKSKGIVIIENGFIKIKKSQIYHDSDRISPEIEKILSLL